MTGAVAGGAFARHDRTAGDGSGRGGLRHRFRLQPAGGGQQAPAAEPGHVCAGAAGQGPGELLRAQAADTYKQLAKAAKAGGVNIMPISGYRSYSQQASLYDSYVSQYGQATADTIAARPGYSEHQTGLAMDIGNASGIRALQACFAILRRGSGRLRTARSTDSSSDIRRAEATTGYTYEPWHLRYVGRAIALDMKNRGIATLEVYFGLEAAPDYLQ